ADGTGALVVSVESLVSRPVAAAQLTPAAGDGLRDALFTVGWVPVPVPDQASDEDLVAEVVLAGGGDSAGAGRAGAGAGVAGEPEIAVRDGNVYGRRLARADGGLVPPGDGMPWRLKVGGDGTLAGLALTACPEAAAPLGPGQVRIAVRAAGVNFRDVLIGLGMYPGAAVMGSDAAAVVLETDPEVTGLAGRDRALGMVAGGFGPGGATDRRL